jgi:hypothetical protein
MPGGRALSAHRAGKLIVKTDGQTETKKHVCKIVLWLVGRPETSSQRQHGPFGLDSDQSAGGPYSIEVQQEEFQIGKLVSNIHRMA